MTDRPWPSLCDRCEVTLSGTVSTMSKFNTEIVCMKCKRKEEQHPDYQRASDAELEAVKRGDFNFPGVGKPSDL